MSNQLQWSISNFWNESVVREDRKLEPRTSLWASELSSAPIEIWHKMRAIQPTSPPNTRSRMKFSAGHIWEFIAGLMFRGTGLLQDRQQVIETSYDIPVRGRFDFIVGGTPDFDRAEREIKSMRFPVEIEDIILGTLNKFREKYQGVSFEECPVEIKSCSSFVSEKLLETESPLKGHALQLSHYVIGGGFKSGKLIYVCKDSSMLHEFNIWNNEDTLDKYKNRVNELAKLVLTDVMPEKEKEILFEDGKFSKNFNLEYSNWLDDLYGFKTPMEYSDKVKGDISRWNRVVSRYSKGEKITDKNKIVRDEIIAAGYDFDKVVEACKKSGDFDDEPTSE